MEQAKDLKTGVKFKGTPIGKIPVDWEITALGKITKFEYGESLPEKDRKEGEIKVFGSNGIVGFHEKPLAEGPGIIIGRKGTVGAVTWVDHDFWAIDTTYYLTAKQTKEELRWLFYLLSNIHLDKLNAATGVPGLNREEAYSEIIPRPPIPEQKKIAEILSTVDEAIEKTDQIIEKTKEIKKGLMQKLLTQGIGHKKFKKTEIGEIPLEWEVGKISDYGEIVTGNTPPTSNPNYYGNEYPFVSPFDLGDKKTIFQAKKYLSNDGFLVSRNLPANAVLVVCIGSTIGKTGIAGTNLATNQQINSIICKDNDYNFVYYYVTFISQKFKQLAGTQAVPILNKGNFSVVEVAIPPRGEQKRIGEILSSVDEETEKETRHKEQLESLEKGLMQVLLTGRIRVNV